MSVEVADRSRRQPRVTGRVGPRTPLFVSEWRSESVLFVTCLMNPDFFVLIDVDACVATRGRVGRGTWAPEWATAADFVVSQQGPETYRVDNDRDPWFWIVISL